MTFLLGQKRGKLWADTQLVVDCLKNQNFNTSGKSEREFEIQVSQYLEGQQNKLNHKLISQYNCGDTVASPKFFGQAHRPDMTIANDGLAIELKYINTSLSGIKHAIGQAYIYRKAYKFVLMVFVLSKSHKELYELEYKDHTHKSDLNDIFFKLADDNIFTIIKPAFEPSKGYGKTIAYFE